MANNNMTGGYCSRCDKIEPLSIHFRNNRVYIRKHCGLRGTVTAVHQWDDPEVYNFFLAFSIRGVDPAGAYVDITSECNLKCNCCYINNEDRRKTFFSKNEASNLKEFRQIYLTGGEPTCHPNLLKIISEFKRMKKRIYLLTNGVKLTKSYISKLKNAGVDCVVLQFDSLYDKHYLKIRNRKMVTHKMGVIENLTKAQIPIILFYCLVKDVNLSQIRNLKKLADNEMVKAVILSPLIPIGKYSGKPPYPSEIMQEIELELGITKDDLIQSKRFILSLQNILTKKIFFSKYTLDCLVLPLNGRFIPITKLFDLTKINRELENIRTRRLLFLYLLFKSPYLILNLFTNKYFRYFLNHLLMKARYVFSGNSLLMNPFLNLVVYKLTLEDNWDENFDRYSSRVYYVNGENRVNQCYQYISRKH